MADDIQLTGVTSGYRNPDVLMQIGFAQGSVAGVVPERKPVLVLPKEASGTFPINTLVWPKSEADVIAGAGSKNGPIYRAWKFWKRIDPNVQIGVIAYAATSGGSATAASTTIVIGGTTATAQKVLTVGFAEIDAQVLINVGDAPSDVALKLRTSLAQAFGPGVISGSAANVIITYPLAGTRGNTVMLTTSTPGNGISVTLPGNLGATTPGLEGSTTEAANFTAALNANSGVRMYNTVSDLGANAAALTAMAAYLLNQALPIASCRETATMGYNGTISAGTALAVAKNFPRLNIANGFVARETPEMIAVQLAALFTKYEAADSTFNFDLYSDADLLLTPIADTSQYPDKTDCNDAIVGGQTLFAVNENNRVFLVKAVTTRVRDDSGAYADWRAYERHRVSGADATGDEVQSAVAKLLAKKKLVDDPLMPDGKTLDRNAMAKLPRGVICPARVQPTVAKILSDKADSGQAQRKGDMLASLKCIRSTDNRGRLLIGYDYYTCDLADQAAIFMAESTPG